METINLRTAAGIWSSLVLAVMEWEDLDTAWRGTFDFVNEHNIKAAKLLYSSAVTDTTIILNYQTLDSFCSKLALKKQSWVFSTFSVKLKIDKTKKFDRMMGLFQNNSVKAKSGVPGRGPLVALSHIIPHHHCTAAASHQVCMSTNSVDCGGGAWCREEMTRWPP